MSHYPVTEGYEESKDSGVRPKRHETTQDPRKFIDIYKHLDAVDKRTRGLNVPRQVLRHRKRQGRKTSKTCTGDISCEFSVQTLEKNPGGVKQKELRAELKRHGESTDGKKAVLNKRLREHYQEFH